MSYGRFFAMISKSTVVLFILMYLNTYQWTHVFWSETRVYMALLMGATMAVIMLGFMLSMYSNKAMNAAIFIGAAAAFAVALWLVRSQVTIGDTSYMRAMIPHHSIAIMTSSRANLSDGRVRKLADEIIYAQNKEIAEMRYLINDIEASGKKEAPGTDAPAEIVSLDEALATAEVAIVDPKFITSDEISRLFLGGATCTFNYTTSSPAVLAMGELDGSPAALIKISGDLVRLDAASAGASALALSTEGLLVNVSAPGGSDALDPGSSEMQEADLVLELDAGLHAGYRGYYRCGT